MKQELPIFDLLRAVDRCDGDWLSRQPAEARKAFSPLTAMRWAATVSDSPEAAYMLWMVNDRANAHLFDLAPSHPNLVFRLLASCGLDRALRHQWLPGGGRRRVNSNAATSLLAQQYPEASDAELEMLLYQHSRDEFMAFLDACGLQSDDKDRVEAVKAYDRTFPEQAPVAKNKAKSKAKK